MTSIERYEKIEDYLKGRLSEEDRRVFESQIETDDELAAEVELHRELIEATGDQEMIDFRQQLDTIAEEVAPAGKSRGRGLWRTLLLAALLIVTGLTAWWWMSPGAGSEEAAETETTVEEGTPSKERPSEEKSQEKKDVSQEEKEPAASQSSEEQPIAKENTNEETVAPQSTTDNQYLAMAKERYEPAAFSVTRDAGNEEEGASSESLFARAGKAYRDADLSEAIAILKKVDPGTPNYLEAWQMLGHAYFQKGQYEAAGQAFQRVMESGYPTYAEEVAWERLLCYLAVGKTADPAFQQLFNELLNDSGHPDHKKALELQEQLQ